MWYRMKERCEGWTKLIMKIKIRKCVYRVFRPVPGAWLSGKKADLVAKVKDLVGLVEDMIRAESKEIGRRRPLVHAAPTRAVNPHADDLSRQLDQKYALEVEIARKTVAALIAAGQFRAPRATKPTSQPKEPKKRGARGAIPVRKEATEEEQDLVARDAQFEDDGIVWQIYSTRWSELEGVTLLYYDVERVADRLKDSGDELTDPEDLLSDDEDVERSSATEVKDWVNSFQRTSAT